MYGEDIKQRLIKEQTKIIQVDEYEEKVVSIHAIQKEYISVVWKKLTPLNLHPIKIHFLPNFLFEQETEGKLEFQSAQYILRDRLSRIPNF